MDEGALITAREAFADAREGLLMRRRGEAQTIRALCDLAACYRVNEEELIAPLLEKFVTVGGDGTPTVSEFLRLEVAALLGCSPAAAAGQIADAINLKFRHPRLYEAVLELRVDAGRALRAAHRCHELDAMTADAVTCRWVVRQAGLGWTAAFNLLDRLIMEADEKLAAEKERKAREDRGVWLWGLFDGVMNLTGRLDVFDARFLDVRLDEMANLLETEFPELNHHQRRAKAIALLASPAHALALLARAAQCELPAPVDGGVGEPTSASPAPTQTPSPESADEPPPDDRSEAPPPPDPHAQDEPTWALEGGDPPRRDNGSGAWWTRLGALGPPAGETAAGGSHECHVHGLSASQDPPGAPPADPRRGRERAGPKPLGRSAPIDVATLAKLRPTLGIAVHIHCDALGNLTGAARVERAGHITVSLLRELLGEGSGNVLKVQPVIDLPNLEPADAYVASPRMRRAVEFVFPTEAFPFSNRRSSGLDLDHSSAFQPGRPGQTRIGNLAPLSRGVHRAKTAGFWLLEQIEPGRLVWTSPLGYRYEVTPFGTFTVPAAERSRRRPRVVSI